MNTFMWIIIVILAVALAVVAALLHKDEKVISHLLEHESHVDRKLKYLEDKEKEEEKDIEELKAERKAKVQEYHSKVNQTTLPGNEEA